MSESDKILPHIESLLEACEYVKQCREEWPAHPWEDVLADLASLIDAAMDAAEAIEEVIEAEANDA